MAIQYIGNTISGVSGDTKPTLSANEKGVIFIETNTNKVYQWDTDSWNEIVLSDASTSAKGIASFSSDNFAASSGAITIKDGGVILGTETTGNYVATVAGTSNEIEVSASTGAVTIGIPTNPTLTGNAIVTGNLTVQGDTITLGDATAVNATQISIDDPMIKLATNNTATDAVDIGFYGTYAAAGPATRYAGLIRDATDDSWYLFNTSGSNDEPTTTLNISGIGLATLRVGSLETSGTIQTSNAAGPALMNEAANNNNPTLIANRVDLTTGIGWRAGEVLIIVGGNETLRTLSSAVELRAAPGVNPFVLETQGASGKTFVIRGQNWSADSDGIIFQTPGAGGSFTNTPRMTLKGGLAQTTLRFTNTDIDLNSNDLLNAGKVGINAAANASFLLEVGGSATLATNGGGGVYIRPTLTLGSGENQYGMYMAPAFVEHSSGTHTYLDTLGLRAPNITDNDATTTNASTLHIFEAPTEGANNYALWVAAGTSRFDGNVVIGTNEILMSDVKMYRSAGDILTIDDNVRLNSSASPAVRELTMYDGTTTMKLRMDPSGGVFRIIKNTTQIINFDDSGVTFYASLFASGNVGIRVGDGSVSAPSYSFTSDTNTGMYWASADQIYFAAGGKEIIRMLTGTGVGGSGNGTYFRIRNTGQADTTNEIAVIDFYPDTRGDNARILVGKEVADWSVNNNRDSYMAFWTLQNNSSAERMRIDSQGTTSLTRSSDSTNETSTVLGITHKTTGNAADGFGPALHFRISDSTGGSEVTNMPIAIIDAQRNGADNYGKLRLQTYNGNTLNENALVVDRLGNVGIGITPPVSKAHIYEDTSTVNSGAGLTIEQDGVGDAVLQFLLTATKRVVLGIDNSDSDKFKIGEGQDLGGNTYLTIDTSGNATFSGDLLELKGGTATQRLTVETTGTATQAEIYLTVAASSTANAWVVFNQGDGTGSANNMRYLLGYDALSSLFRLHSTDINGASADGDVFHIADGTNDVAFLGGVGIGASTAPTSGLDMNNTPISNLVNLTIMTSSNTATEVLNIEAADGANRFTVNPIRNLAPGDHTSVVIGDDGIVLTGVADSTYTNCFNLVVNALVYNPNFSNQTITNAATLRVVGPPAGSVNFTNGPYALWVDAGNSRFDGHIFLSDDNPIFWGVSNTANIRGIDGDGSYLEFGTKGAVRMRLDADGNLGIGTTNPATNLHVKGTATAGHVSVTIESTTISSVHKNSDLLYKTGGVRQWNAGVAGLTTRYMIGDADGEDGVYLAQGSDTWTGFTSDERKKTNWIPFTNALDKLATLTKLGTYQRINPTTNELKSEIRWVGISANEVQEILPEAVDETLDPNDGETYLSLRYQDVFVLMLKAIQELKIEVDALKAS